MKSDAFNLQTPTQEPGLATAMEVIFQWNYDSEVEELRRLYVKAAEAQWVSERDLDWDRPIDLARFASTPLGLSLPLEKTSFWKAQPEELYLPRDFLQATHVPWTPDRTFHLLEGLVARAKVRAQAPRDDGPSRKGPCPCGSGKKYKRCCGE